MHPASWTTSSLLCSMTTFADLPVEAWLLPAFCLSSSCCGHLLAQWPRCLQYRHSSVGFGSLDWFPFPFHVFSEVNSAIAPPDLLRMRRFTSAWSIELTPSAIRGFVLSN